MLHNRQKIARARTDVGATGAEFGAGKSVSVPVCFCVTIAAGRPLLIGPPAGRDAVTPLPLTPACRFPALGFVNCLDSQMAIACSFG